MEINDFKHAVGKFPTGVCIITTTYLDQNFGFTANSFVSVSLEPALISFCLEMNAHSLIAFENSDYFNVNILAQEQSELASKFARSGINKFAGTDYELNEQNIPVIKGSISLLECKKNQIIPCGDHFIFIGKVKKVSFNNHIKPLLYYGKQFLGL